MKTIQEYINLYDRLESLANDYLRSKDKDHRNHTITIYRGSLSYEINTACSCHPEMETIYINTEDFQKWGEENKWTAKLNDDLEEPYEE